MNSYLLDTHILLWTQLDPNKLSKVQRSILESSDNQKFLSIISVWELSLKYSISKIDLGDRTPEEFVAGIYNYGLSTTTPTAEQYATFHRLPKVLEHRDPFDRMIIWQAISSGLTLISSDKKLADYKIHGLQLV